MKMQENENLNVRVGIHTGHIVAGIIGTKLVKYDIFGEDVLTAYKVKSNTARGQVNVTKATLNLLAQSPKIMRNYETEESATFFIPSILRQVQTYSIRWRETSGGEDEADGRQSADEYGSEGSEDSEEGPSHESSDESDSEDEFGMYLKKDETLAKRTADKQKIHEQPRKLDRHVVTTDHYSHE
jgi:hypothetical protein